jgi:hypothetical protein
VAAYVLGTGGEAGGYIIEIVFWYHGLFLLWFIFFLPIGFVIGGISIFAQPLIAGAADIGKAIHDRDIPDHMAIFAASRVSVAVGAIGFFAGPVTPHRNFTKRY